MIDITTVEQLVELCSAMMPPVGYRTPIEHAAWMITLHQAKKIKEADVLEVADLLWHGVDTAKDDLTSFIQSWLNNNHTRLELAISDYGREVSVEEAEEYGWVDVTKLMRQ